MNNISIKYYERKKILLPKQSDLSYFNWNTGICFSNDSENFKIDSNIEKKEYLSVYFKMSMTALQKLSKEYDEIHPIHELGPDSTLAFVHQDKISELKSKLSLINIVFKPTGHKSVAYHTRLISNYEDDILKSYEDIELQPLKNDFFSSSSAISLFFWYFLIILKCLFVTVFTIRILKID